MEEYIQQLLKDQGVPADLDDETRRELAKQTQEQATDFLNRRMLEAMSDEAVVKFNDMLDDEQVSPELVQAFVESNVPDRETVAAKALLEFRTLYLGVKA